MTDEIDLDAVEMHAIQGYTRASSTETREHLLAILDELGADVPREMSECPRCGPSV